MMTMLSMLMAIDLPCAVMRNADENVCACVCVQISVYGPAGGDG